MWRKIGAPSWIVVGAGLGLACWSADARTVLSPNETVAALAEAEDRESASVLGPDEENELDVETLFIRPPFRPRPDRPPVRGEWRLSVHADKSETGMIITHVIRGGAGDRAGLERGDRIIAVGNQRVGFVGRQSPSFRQAIQRQAGSHGNVLLLVQNRRNRNLVNLNVQLDGGEGAIRPFGGD